MNETTRELSTPPTNTARGADAPLTERAPYNEKTQAARAALENGSAGRKRHLVSLAFALLWLGALCAYLWGYYGKTDAPLPGASTIALALGIAFVPVFIVAVLVEIAAQTRRLARLARQIARAALRVNDIEAQMGEGAAQAGLVIRRELDALSAALDATLARVAAVEEMLDNQVGAIERVGDQAQERTQAMRDLLQAERVQLASVAEELGRSTQTIAQTLGSHIAAARQASLRGEEELRKAEAALTRQSESFTHAAGIKLEEINAASQALEDAARQSLVAADRLTTRLSEEHGVLSSDAERLQAMSGQLDALLGAARDLVERAEKSVDEIVQGIGAAMSEAGAHVDAALEGARARAAEASRSLRVEAEAATAAGGTAAQAIEAAAGTARRAAQEMRASLGTEVTALSGMLSGGTRSLDEAAATVARGLTGAGDAARALIASLEETLRTVESASARLFGVLDSVTQRSSAARGTLDNASREMEDRLAHLPELAGEHAARLSALLEDQASRMNALAEAFGARAKPAPQAPVREAAEPPAHAVAETPATPEAPSPEPPAAAAALHADKDEAAAASGSVRRFSLLRRRESSEAERHAPQAQAPEQEAEGTTGGFWSALFSRIEGETSASRPPISVPDETDEERMPRHEFESAALAVVEGLHALAVDLDRLLEEEPPLELWKRYRSGERNVFARRLLTLKGQGIEERIRHKYRDDIEFREHTDHYMERFEELLSRARAHDRERILEDTYLSSHTGRLYQLLKDAMGE